MLFNVPFLEEEKKEKIFKHPVTRRWRFVCALHLKTKNSLVLRDSGDEEYLGRWTPRNTQIMNWIANWGKKKKKSTRSAAKGGC